MVEFNLFSLFGLSVHFHMHWPERAEAKKVVEQNESAKIWTTSRKSDAAKVIYEFDWFYRHPITGDLVPMRNVPPQLVNRVVNYLAEEREISHRSDIQNRRYLSPITIDAAEQSNPRQK